MEDAFLKFSLFSVPDTKGDNSSPSTKLSFIKTKSVRTHTHIYVYTYAHTHAYAYAHTYTFLLVVSSKQNVSLKRSQ